MTIAVKCFIKPLIKNCVSGPRKGTDQSAGWDICANADVLLDCDVVHKVPTGLFFEIPNGYYGQIKDRSSMAAKGIFVVGGVIDSDYRGEISVLLYRTRSAPMYNLSNVIKRGERIAQIIFLPCPDITITLQEKLEDLSNTTRGSGGFGSTNVEK